LSEICSEAGLGCHQCSLKCASLLLQNSKEKIATIFAPYKIPP
jgi:hypothetical protein